MTVDKILQYLNEKFWIENKIEKDLMYAIKTGEGLDKLASKLNIDKEDVGPYFTQNKADFTAKDMLDMEVLFYKSEGYSMMASYLMSKEGIDNKILKMSLKKKNHFIVTYFDNGWKKCDPKHQKREGFFKGREDLLFKFVNDPSYLGHGYRKRNGGYVEYENIKVVEKL